MRSLISFPCEQDTLVATLDSATGSTGVLIVSGGNEIRSGAHRGMAMLARKMAAAGTPVFRYDRRGIGDSTGENQGFGCAQADLVAAAAAFRSAAPHVTRLVGFGNCDAASTLALFGRSVGIDRVLLANPWIVEPVDDLPPAAAIRIRYAQRLRDPASWSRMLRGQIDLRKLARGLARLAQTKRTPEVGLAEQVCGAIDAWGDAATILLASGDATAQAFAARYRGSARTVRIETASHSFAGSENAAALEMRIAEMVDALTTDSHRAPS